MSDDGFLKQCLVSSAQVLILLLCGVGMTIAIDQKGWIGAAAFLASVLLAFSVLDWASGREKRRLERRTILALLELNAKLSADARPKSEGANDEAP